MSEEARLRKRLYAGNDGSMSSKLDGVYGEGIFSLFPWKFPLFSTVIGLVIGYSLLYLLSKFADGRSASPVAIHEAPSKQGTFVAERAYKHLERLTSLGPRVVGSYENEIRTVDLLLREVGFIKQLGNPSNKIDIDVQRPSGFFVTQERNGMNTIYEKVANVVVRIGPSNDTDSFAESLLVNAHFDTAPGSPGASDNGVSVAVALEVLEVLSRKKVTLKHPVVFLFNGAEESSFQGAHGFITQHRWAKEVGAFINLDACGAGGREIVFQAGPGNPWLMKAYAASVRYPFANIMGQEIFEAGLIPSDTDFKVFRDYGKIPGLDLAYIKNGYVYHTKYDDLQQLTLSDVQTAGENLLGLVDYLAQSDWPDKKDFEEKFVYLDYLGLFMITLSRNGWHVLNICIIGISIYQTTSWIRNSGSDLPSETVCKQVILSTLSCLISWICALVVVSFAIGFITLFRSTMSWYSRPYLLLGLYAVPAAAVLLFGFLFMSSMQLKSLGSTSLVERVQFEGVKLNLTFIVTVSYLFLIQSNTLLIVWLVFAIFGRWLLDWIYQHKRIDRTWFLLHFATFAVPVVQTFYLAETLLSVLIPIAGRSGPHSNPEFLVAMAVGAIFLLTFSFCFTLSSMIRNARRLLLVLILIHVTVVLAVLLTPLGFPYSASLDSIKPQRVQILHVERTFYESNGRVRSKEAGYWLFTWDYHISKELLKPFQSHDNVPSLVEESKCHSLPYCGLPYYFPYLNRIRSSYWISAPRPLIYHPAKVHLTEQRITGVNLRSLSLTLTGPDHMVLMLWPFPGVELIGFSSVQGKLRSDPYYKERPLYFIYYVYGMHPEPYNFTVDLKVPVALSGKSVLEVAVTSHILHGQEQMSADFANKLRQFPTWTYAYGWIASYSHWIF